MSMRARPSTATVPGQPPPASLKETLAASGRVLQLAWTADRSGFSMLVAASVLTTSAHIAKVRASRLALDAVLGRQPWSTQARRLLVVGGTGLAAVVGSNLTFRAQAPVGQAVGRLVEGRILDVLAGLELADVENPDFQDRLHQILSGVHGHGQLLSSAVNGLQGAVSALGAVVSMGVEDRALVPLGLVSSAVQMWSSRRRDLQRLHPLARSNRERWQLRHALTGTAGAHELRLYGVGPALRQRYDAIADQEAVTLREASRRDGRSSLLRSLAGRAVSAPVAGRSLQRMSRGRLSVAAAAGTSLATGLLRNGVSSTVNAVILSRHSARSAKDYTAFVRPSKPRLTLTGPSPRPSFQEIVVDDLSFAYRGTDRLVLDGVSLRIGRGEVVALVGENGSGKTTLAKLLCCLYQPTSGLIRWDDVDIGRCEPALARVHIAAVFQDFVRYGSLTAAENIAMGRPELMDDGAAIEQAARHAGAHSIITDLPDGYATVLSVDYGGVNLSTGQWQRVALARAFLRDAPFVVLDEPTAALDPRAERDLFESVASLYRDRSALLISHRLSSVRFADRVCVLDGGRIVETGSHDELMAASGAYAELFDLQARAYR